MTTVISLASLLIAVIAVVLSAGFAYRQVVEMRRTNAITLALNVFAEFRSREFKARVERIFSKLESGSIPPTAGFSNLPEPIRDDAYHVSHFYDTLGALVAHKLVDDELIFAFMGEAIDRVWYLLEPYVVGERQLRAAEYQVYFENLAEMSKQKPAKQLRRKYATGGHAKFLG